MYTNLASANYVFVRTGDLKTLLFRTFVLAPFFPLQRHNVPVCQILPEGRIEAMQSKLLISDGPFLCMNVRYAKTLQRVQNGVKQLLQKLFPTQP